MFQPSPWLMQLSRFPTILLVFLLWLEPLFLGGRLGEWVNIIHLLTSFTKLVSWNCQQQQMQFRDPESKGNVWSNLITGLNTRCRALKSPQHLQIVHTWFSEEAQGSRQEITYCRKSDCRWSSLAT